MTELVILVDDNDREVGHEEKLRVHTSPRLHRAVSVFVFDDAGRMLLQRRASAKYHSGGLWSNTCCGHPRPGETAIDAARRRLFEEMGLACSLFLAGTAQYAIEVGGGLAEHELVHVFAGFCRESPRPDAREVSAWKWVDHVSLNRAIRERPTDFTAWFRVVLATLEAPGPCADGAEGWRGFACGDLTKVPGWFCR